jgi:hypothetical protein
MCQNACEEGEFIVYSVESWQAFYNPDDSKKVTRRRNLRKRNEATRSGCCRPPPGKSADNTRNRKLLQTNSVTALMTIANRWQNIYHESPDGCLKIEINQEANFESDSGKT